jgi:hypothetical protein
VTSAVGLTLSLISDALLSLIGYSSSSLIRYIQGRG